MSNFVDNLQKCLILKKGMDSRISCCYNSSHERRGDEKVVIVDVISRLILYVLLTVAVMGDIKEYRISNRLILVGLGLAFLFRLVGSGLAGIIWFLPDIIFPVVVLYLLYLSGILGAGDIKLFSVICGFTNLRFTAGCMVISALAAAVHGIIKMLVQKELAGRVYSGIIYFKNILCGQFTRFESNGKEVYFSVYMLLGTAMMDILRVWCVYISR